MSTKPPKLSSGNDAPVVDSLLTRTLFVPVLFVSFIISLFIVDRSTSAGVFSHDDPKDPDHGKSHYYHSNQRKLAKKEMDEAFALRGRVIAAMCITSATGLALTGWAMSKAWAHWASRYPA